MNVEEGKRVGVLIDIGEVMCENCPERSKVMDTECMVENFGSDTLAAIGNARRSYHAEHGQRVENIPCTCECSSSSLISAGNGKIYCSKCGDTIIV